VTPIKLSTNSASTRPRERPTRRKRRSAVRRVSVSTTSSDRSHTAATSARRRRSMLKTKQMPVERQTRQSAKRLLYDIDSGSDNESKSVPEKRALRSSSYRL